METKLVVQNTIIGLRIYNAFMLFIYVACSGLMMLMPFLSKSSKYLSSTSRFNNDDLIVAAVMLVVLIPFVFIHLLALVIAGKQSRANWIFQIIVVALGFTSFLTLIPAIFLLIGLVSEETKAYYFKDKDKTS